MEVLKIAYQNLILEIEDKLAVLKINRPRALNALNSELLGEMAQAISELENNSDVKAIIITGEGNKAFVAGADIAEMKEMNEREAEDFARKGQGVLTMLEQSAKPVIAAVNGFALGGGNELALACDIRIASIKAKFGQPEVGLGIIAGFGGTQRLTKIVGPAYAKEILFTGEMIDAAEALRIGLVNHVVPVEDDLLAKARELAEKIVKNAPVAIELTKKAVNYAVTADIDTGLEHECSSFAKCFKTEDQKNGMAAFLNKEKVVFKGK